METDIATALAQPGCERLREWASIGPVQLAALELFVDELGTPHCTEKLNALHANHIALQAECEALKKANALLQQHHATAWNRGHEMGMMANRQTAREALKAVASDAWGNTQLTEALLAAEAECEALRAKAARYDWLTRRDGEVSVLAFKNDCRNPFTTIRASGSLNVDGHCDCVHEAIDAAMAAMGKEKA
jgi:hypothetical protein